MIERRLVMKAKVLELLNGALVSKVQLENGAIVQMLNNGVPINIGDVVEVSAVQLNHTGDYVFLLQSGGYKYFRAQINDNGRIRYMDAVGYTSKTKFASDLRSNGYRVKFIVDITSPFEMKKETFESGSYAFN
jgi:translation initiation factor IF-1